MTASNKKDIALKTLQPLFSLVANVVLAYLVYLVARVAYLLENYSFFKEGLNFGHLMRMFRGGLMFDTTALVYSNALYILLMLFPLWLKETDAYHRFCRWLFVVVNAIGLFLNLCDAVYFPFTLRRTTTSVFREFDNENNLGGIFTTELVNHWYFRVAFRSCSVGYVQALQNAKEQRFRLQYASNKVAICRNQLPIVGTCRCHLCGRSTWRTAKWSAPYNN